MIKVSFPGMAPDPSDVQLIQLIVETAGTAFENARLHEQANEVIQELRFINDLTKRINQSLRLRDVFHDATHEPAARVSGRLLHAASIERGTAVL